MATDPVTEPQPGPAAAHPWPRHSVRALFEARSVALVGASTRPGSVGATMVRQLRDGGYRGAILPVNPRHREIEGLPCVPSLDDLPHAVDLAVLAVPEASLEHEFTRAVDHGVSGAVIFGSPRDRRADSDAGAPPVAEPGDGGQGRAAGHAHAVRARMAEAAARTGMVVCGPNCMGFIDFPNRLRAVAYFEPFERRPGPVTFISHSGSVFSAMLHNRRAIEFDLAISAGEELTSTVADYIRHAVARETTRVIGLFLETVRDPRGFLHALALAAERDVPIVALTVGRTAVARRLVEAHSGAVAGDDAAFEAVFDRYGVLRVETLDELADSLELLAAGRRARPGGLAAVLDSGGERAHLLDVAASAGVRFAEPAPATTRRLEDALEPGLPAVNPLDAWGTMSLYEHVYRESIAALLDDPDTGALVLAVDITPEEDLALGYVPLLEEMAAGTDVPVAVLGHASTAIGPVQADRLRRGGIPVLEGTRSGLRALRGLFQLRDARSRPDPRPPEPPAEEVRARWLQRLRGGVLRDDEALALLSDYGVPVVPHGRASTEEEACRVAERLGWPVVLKTSAPGLTHKTEVSGVVTSIRDEAGLRAAYRELSARLGPDVLVAGEVQGVELALGTLVDPQFGPLVLVGAGGVLVELLRDRAVALAPTDERWAGELVDRLSIRRLLDGHRGAPPADTGSLCRAVAVLSVLAADLAPSIAAVDVNPFIVGPAGGVAVDALVVPGSHSPQRGRASGSG